MKYSLLYTLLAIIAAFNNAQAATILEIQNGVSVYADSVINKPGTYFDQTFAGFATSSPITKSTLATDITGGDLTKYAWTPNAHLPSDKLPAISPVTNTYVDLSFSSNIYNGVGADLVLFFAGTGTNFIDGHSEQYLFSIDVGADGSNEGGPFDVTASTTSDIYGDKFFASYAMIDLDDFGFDRSTPLGDIRIYLGDSSMPALAALGAYHITAVPLPLSSVLFGSGLALLSLFRRKPRA